MAAPSRPPSANSSEDELDIERPKTPKIDELKAAEPSDKQSNSENSDSKPKEIKVLRVKPFSCRREESERQGRQAPPGGPRGSIFQVSQITEEDFLLGDNLTDEQRRDVTFAHTQLRIRLGQLRENADQLEQRQEEQQARNEARRNRIQLIQERQDDIERQEQELERLRVEIEVREEFANQLEERLAQAGSSDDEDQESVAGATDGSDKPIDVDRESPEGAADQVQSPTPAAPSPTSPGRPDRPEAPRASNLVTFTAQRPTNNPGPAESGVFRAPRPVAAPRRTALEDFAPSAPPALHGIGPSPATFQRVPFGLTQSPARTIATARRRSVTPLSIIAPPRRYNASRFCITAEGVPAARARAFLLRVVPYHRLLSIAAEFGVPGGLNPDPGSAVSGIINHAVNANQILTSAHISIAQFEDLFPHWELPQREIIESMILELWARGLDLYWATYTHERS